MHKHVSVIGAGLSGCEAALVLARNGYDVSLYDQKPVTLLPPYTLSSFAELVCNNSFSPINHNSPLGLLLSELKMLKSPLIELADSSRLRDNVSFSVDKKKFSKLVTESLKEANVKNICCHVTELPPDDILLLATGPLSDGVFIEEVSKKTGARSFHFSDASSIVVDIESINTEDPHFLKISDDLYGVTLSLNEFHSFYHLLVTGNRYVPHFDGDRVVLKECQSLENIAMLGESELISRKFSTSFLPGISFLLRRENGLENGFIMVGFMSTLCHADQRQALLSLPGFNNVRIIKYGRAHRNTYFDAPSVLNDFYKVNNCNQEIYIIGQISGIDGYVPCISSGFVAAYRIINGGQAKSFPKETMIGALSNYVSNTSILNYSPMCASFSLLRKNATTQDDYYVRSMEALKQFISNTSLNRSL